MPKSTLYQSVSFLLHSLQAKKSGPIKKSLRIVRSSFLLLAVFIASGTQIAHAQFSSGCTNCVAQDIKVEDVILKGYPPSSCKEFGYPIPSDTLSILFNVTASERYGLLFVANLVVDDTFRTVISHCFETILYQGYQTLDIKISEHSLLNQDTLSKLLLAGRKIRLTNVFLGWDNNKNANPPFTAAFVACSAYDPVTKKVDCQKVQGNGAAPKCKYYLEAIGVRAPAKPELTLDSTRNVNCFGDSTGAIFTSVTPATQYYPYQYQWKRGGTAYPASIADITGIPAGTYSVIVKMDGCSDTLQNIIITQPASAVSATTQVVNNVKCYGETTGKAYVTGSGGTPFTVGSPYKYKWMPGGQTTDTAYDLAGGNYTVTVEDSLGCKITKTVTITTPTALSATMDSTNICFSGAKGSATVTVTGGTQKSGTQKYTYSWNTTPIQTTATASNLDSGTYTVTVTDSMGCTLTKSVRIRQPDNFLSSTTTQKNVYCKGDSTGWAKVSVSGGLKPAKGFVYTWNTVPPKTTDSISRLKAGTYIVTVKDSLNCTIYDTVTITEPATALAATATVAIQVKCFGGTTGKAYVTASGGTQKAGAKKYTYSWNTSPLQTTDTAVGLAAGTYTVTVTDSLGCTIQKSVTITQPASALTADTSKTNDCKLDTSGTATVTVQGGTPYKTGASYRYSWNTTPVQTTATATKLAAGTYTVTITDSLGCTLHKSITILKPATPLRADTSKVPVKCYGGSTGSATVTVSGGKTPYQYSWNTNPVQTNATATHLSAGTYTVTISDALKCSIQKSITVIQAPSPLTADTSKINVSCYGDSTGSATVTVSGGLPKVSGYLYSWNTTPVQTTATATKLTAGRYTVTITDSLGCEIQRSITVSQPSNGMKADTSKVHVKCFGDSTGSAYVSVSGGTPPYKYSWNTTPVQTTASATNLKAGKYTVTITDSTGCSLIKNITVTQPTAPLSADTSKKNVCFGDSTGSATVTVSGGTAPYRYSWNTLPVQTTATATNLKAGTYTVTVTDTAGCTLQRSITITQGNSALKADSSVTNVKCNGDSTGTATVTVSGGMPPYKYQWNTSPAQTTATATKLRAGTYNVTITDSMGCALVKSVVVRQPDSALSATVNKTDLKCNEDSTGSATVSVKGGTGPYRYSWNTSPVQTTATATKLVIGTYTVTITDSLGCVLTKSVTITKTSNLNIDTSKVNVKCFGDSTGSATVVVSGGKSPYTYHWNTSPVQTTATATHLPAGVYTVTVTDSSGCSSQRTVTISQPAAGLTATTTRTNICTADGKGTATVTPSGGTPKATGYLYSWNTTPIQTTATATNLSAGTYTVTVTDSLGCTLHKTVSILKAGAVLSATIDSTNVACYGQSTGSATANPSGGIPPYSYSWNTTPLKTTASITNLAAGSYKVTITDSIGCTFQKTVIITQPAAALNATAQASKGSICKGDTSVIKVTASGGTAPYYYKLGAGSYQKSIDSFIVTEPNTYTITVKDSLNCTKTVNVTVADKGCNNFCTYSQGYFGTDNNGQASYNNGDGCKKTATRLTIQASLSWWTAKGMDLKVGNINVSSLSDPVQAIIDYLPGGGPSTAYTGSTLDGNTPKNTLLAQTLTLGLNIGLNQNLSNYKISNGSIIVQRNNGTCGTGSPIIGECKTFSVDASFNGKTIKEIFDAAGAALVSGTPEQRNKYASLVSTINEAFHGCGQAVSSCATPGIVNNWINTDGLETPQAALQVITYPNPITDHVYIQFVSPVSGDAIVEVYDFTGRRLKQINKTNVIANQDNLIKYMIPKVRHTQLVYRITVGKYSARGILLSPPQQ